MITPIASAEAETADSTVLCRNSQRLELHVTSVGISRFQAAFELYGPVGILRVSEVLPRLIQEWYQKQWAAAAVAQESDESRKQ